MPNVLWRQKFFFETEEIIILSPRYWSARKNSNFPKQEAFYLNFELN